MKNLSTIRRFARQFLVASLSLALLPAIPAQAEAYDAHPKLVVILVIDQFRGDMLQRYAADFKGNGFRLLTQQGAYFPDCYFEYANTKTAPGHATIGTGVYTDGHGISGNEWWDLDRFKDHQISSVDDERYKIVGAPQSSASTKPGARNYTPGQSPLNLRASTVGDELRLATQGKARVYGVSLKDRAAILPSGQAANAAFWIDAASGHFITSTYYLSALPRWAEEFNASGESEQLLKQAAPTGSSFYTVVGRTPLANTHEINFAEALITGEHLGANPDGVTDMLTLSLSAHDILGHQKGPDSPDEQAMVDALDRDLDSFFSWLDKNVGLANVVIAFSADHGIAPVPEQAARLGINSTTIDLKAMAAEINKQLNDKLVRKINPTLSFIHATPELPYIALNGPSFEQVGVEEKKAEEMVRDLSIAAVAAQAPKPEPLPANHRLAPTPAIFRAYTKVDLAEGKYPQNELGHLLAHSYSPNGGWWVMLIPNAYQQEFFGIGRTNHYTPYSYDRHVPLAFYGAAFKPGVYRGRVAPVDLAATLASLLGINQPSASVGKILTQALKPTTLEGTSAK
jgi:arylsulfatase A-like enzyme